MYVYRQEKARGEFAPMPSLESLLMLDNPEACDGDLGLDRVRIRARVTPPAGRCRLLTATAYAPIHAPTPMHAPACIQPYTHIHPNTHSPIAGDSDSDSDDLPDAFGMVKQQLSPKWTVTPSDWPLQPGLPGAPAAMAKPEAHVKSFCVYRKVQLFVDGVCRPIPKP